MVGATTVATRLNPDGPYDAISDGVNGFLVNSASDWYPALARLATSPAFRADVARCARERDWPTTPQQGWRPNGRRHTTESPGILAWGGVLGLL
jgi:hypothetical protein